MQIDTADMEQALLRQHGTELYYGPKGRVILNKDGTVMSDVQDGEALCTILQRLGLSKHTLFSLKSQEAADAVCRAYGLGDQMPCTQAVYLKSAPPEMQPCDIRRLGEEYAETLAAHYHPESDTLPYLRERIAAGQMWGLFEDGRLAGFIGMHSEGSMGLLEILPEFRRRGYGYQLEAYLIALHLQRGWTPYCHIVYGNEASLRLQEKLGLSFAKLPAIWVG